MILTNRSGAFFLAPVKTSQFLKFTPLNARLFRYICDCRSNAGDPVLEALRAETAALGEIAEMQIGPDQGALMTLLVAAIGARDAIEVGTFTGYSSICIARGLPPRGRLLCLDSSAEWTAIARKHWARAKVNHKIELRLAPAIESLKKLEAGRSFDFAFIDALKAEYEDYYELVLPRMRANGLILLDNMLWGGRLGGSKPIKAPGGRMIDRMNRKLARDKRVDSVLLSVGDGLRICRVKK
ncbi:MAG TPA: class I SAM-dependent methyltransferase [Candidatus Baltobacteraceae bacterium]|jgi:caffeoyl-CoA O-methyltransferase|nr:class I SAM-dependent methyltransferase [Candidatus Baltobacteraceae bacterium]